MLHGRYEFMKKITIKKILLILFIIVSIYTIYDTWKTAYNMYKLVTSEPVIIAEGI